MPIRLKDLGIKGIAKVRSKWHVYWLSNGAEHLTRIGVEELTTL